jgi:selenocysteine-specific elongation factor
MADFHQQFPLRPGMPRERLKSHLGLDAGVFDSILATLADEGVLVESGADLWLSQHRIVFSLKQQAQIDALLRDFEDQPYAPPAYKQSVERIGEELLTAMITTKLLVRVGEDVLLLPQVFQDMRQAVIDHINQHGSITLAELRDQFETSRKYAVAVLEYLDQTGVTMRRGDVRELAKSRS